MAALTDALIGGTGAAVLGVAGTLAAALWSDRQSKIRDSAAEFRQAVQALVDLRMQYYDYRRANATDQAAIDFTGGALNNKRQLHKATAEKVKQRASGQLTADDYVTLGYEYEADSEFHNAIECYQEALDQANASGQGRDLQQAVVLRSLGSVLLRPTKWQQRTEGEACLRRAIDATRDETDDYSRQATGMSYESLAFGLWVNQDPGWQDALTDAGDTYQAMDPAYPGRASWLQRVQASRAFFGGGDAAHARFALSPAPIKPRLELDDVHAVQAASVAGSSAADR